jgi:transcription elongation factor GreA
MEARIKMAEEQFILSRTGYEILKQELAELETEHQQRLAEFADVNYDVDPTPEEAAYFDTRVMKEQVEERIGHLQLVLSRAEVIDDDPDPHRVDPGEMVTVWDFDEKRERVFNLVSSAETVYARDAIPGREVSLESPVGQALLGKSVGDVIEIDVPDGKTKYAIRRIEPIG